jgi:hypothetical protein
MADNPSNVIQLFEHLKEQVNIERNMPPLRGGGGDGTLGGMEARVAKVEASLEHIRSDITDIKTDLRGVRDNARTDFRLLFGAIITVAIGLAGIMAKGFHWF